MTLEEIKELMGSVPEANSPFYVTSEANVQIPLYQGPIAIRQKETEIQCEGEITFVWLPLTRIRLQISTTDQTMLAQLALLELEKCSVAIPEYTLDAQFSIIGKNFNSGAENSIVIEAITNNSISLKKPEGLRYFIVHGVNFHQLIAERNKYSIEEESPKFSTGRVKAEFGDWSLIIDNVKDIQDLSQRLKNQRGYGITHVMRLEKTDNSLFTVEEARELQKALTYFFSFARGFWSPLILPVGYNEQNEVVWQEWQAERATSWTYRPNWFCDRSYVSETLESTLRGFWNSWSNPIWENPSNNNTPLRNAVHWFISANNDAGSMEGSIILAQTGLELMSWVLLVEATGKFAESIFDTDEYRPAKRKFLELLAHIGVSNEIPSTLKYLSPLATSKNWTSGPEALIKYRNTLVHPKSRTENSDVVFRETYDILQLALWYLELSILYIFDFNGSYMNRVSGNEYAGVTEKVPWVLSA